MRFMSQEILYITRSALMYHLLYFLKFSIRKSSRSLIMPVFYDRKTTSRMESLHTTYLKRALGVKMQTSNLAILGESGRHPLIATQEKLVLFYWLKIQTTPLTNPLRIVYEELYRFSNADHITWCKMLTS